jgi:tetratricopeptide (TPR) repeat protein
MPDHAGWSPTRLRTEAIAAERSGQAAQAVALLEEALRRDGADWKSVRLLAALLARLGRRRPANDLYRRLAAHYESDQLLAKAISVWKMVLVGEPDFVSAHVKLGELYALGGFRAEARKHYREALATYRATARAREAALVEDRLADLDEASNPGKGTRVRDDGVKDVDDADFVEERLAQGRLFRRFGLVDLARGQLAEVIARFPDNVEARRELRDLLLEAGRHEEAAAHEAALAKPVDCERDPVGDLAGLEVPTSPGEDDVPELDLELEPLAPDDHLEVDLDDEWTGAGREIRSAFDGQVDREDAETRYDLGIAYREMGLVDEAIAELQLASRGPSRVVECASLLAACFLDKGLPKLAVKWLERGLAVPGLNPDQALSLRYDLAGAHEARGDEGLALEIYVELYGEDAGFRDVAEKLRRLRRHGGRAEARQGAVHP